MYKEALRQVWAEIDMGAFDHNVKQIAKQLNGVPMIGVIKANGYGHGATECAKVLAHNGCDTFAVATLEEAVNLREDGIGGNIIVLGLTPTPCYDVVVEYGVTPVMMSIENLKILAEAVKEAKANGTFATKANLDGEYEQKYMFVLDTGMGRIGYRVYTEEDRQFACKRFVEMQEQVKELKVFGIMTHFSTADEEQREYTGSQIDNYKAFYKLVEEAGYTPRKICANSAAIMVYPDVHFDAARPGIILYGLYPSGYLFGKVLDLKPVMSLKAEILNLQDVPAGQSVSYARKFTSNRPTKLAVIGLGYADGYTRLYSGKIEVLVGGKRCPVVGNICMDQCMVDVTDVPDVAYGDEVVLIGTQGNETITADEIASLTGTINYEVTCLLDLRVPKVYKNYPEGMCK